MKLRTFIFVLSLALLYTGCSSEQNSLDATSKKINKSSLVGKKGIAYANKTNGWKKRTEKLHVNWMYSWGNDLHDSLPKGLDFTPMFWSKKSVVDENIQRLKRLKNEGKIKYILAFNEPDRAKQANMTVDEAINLWPKLEEIGLPLGSPSPSHPDKEWMKEFMHKADSLNLRVDFVCVHHYGDDSAEDFLNKLKRVHKMYDKPIWITEFAVADWEAESLESNIYTQGDVVWFLKKVLPVLEELDYVERYAWFDGRRAPLISSSLYDENFELTKVGEYYAAFKN